MKRILFSLVLMVSFNAIQAVDYSRDEQQQLVKKLTKKVLRAQAAGKSDQLILDELMSEVVAEFDDSHELIKSQDNSDRLLLVAGIIVGILVVGIGGYVIYKYCGADQTRQGLSPQQERDFNVFISAFPMDLRAPLREAIRNGSDQNLVHFLNAAERGDVNAVGNIAIGAILRLNPQQQIRVAEVANPQAAHLLRMQIGAMRGNFQGNLNYSW